MIATVLIPLITVLLNFTFSAVAIWKPDWHLLRLLLLQTSVHSAVAAFDAWGHNLALSVSEKTTPKPFTVGQNFPPTAVWRRSRVLNNVSKANHYAKATLKAFSVAINYFMLSNYNNKLVAYCFVSVSWQTRFLFLTVIVHLAAQYGDQMSATWI